MRGVYRGSFTLLKTNFSALVWFEILYKLLATVTLYPLLLYLLDFSVKRAGISYLTNNNLTKFLTNPVSVIITLLIIVIIVAYSLLELVVLTICFELSRNGEKTDVVELFFAGLRKTGRILRPDSFVFFLFILSASAVFNLPFASSLLSMTGVGDYLGNFFHTYHILYIVTAAVMAAVIYLISSSLFSLHYMVLEGSTFSASRKASRNLMKGWYRREALRFALWYALLLLCLLLLYTALIISAAYLVRRFFPAETAPAVFLSVSRVTASFISVVIYIFFVPLLLSMISSLFYSQKEQANEQTASNYHTNSLKKFKKTKDVFLVAILAVSIVLNFNVVYTSLRNGEFSNIEAVRTASVTAHRGSSAETPENTLSAVRNAADEMADFAEIDVRATKDGVVVLLHDESLRRTTGDRRKIWEVTYEETQALDAGGWLSDQYTNERIPTLEEIIQYANGKIKLNIEIKTSDESPGLVESVVNIIRDNGFEDQCVISTFNYSVLSEIKSLDPDIRTGIIITAAIGNYTHLKNVDFFSMSAISISRAKVEKLHLQGYEVYAWGVYDAGTVSRMLEAGVDNIITDDTLMAKQVVYTTSANPIVLKVSEFVFGATDLKAKSIRTIFFPYW